MAALTYVDLLTLTVAATGTIRQGRAVTFAGAEASSAGSKAIGIAKHGAASGEQVAVQVQGVAIAVAGASVTVGNALVSDSQGRLIPATAVSVSVAAGATGVTSSAANGAITTVAGGELPQDILGYAMTAATNAGDEIQVLLK